MGFDYLTKEESSAINLDSILNYLESMTYFVENAGIALSREKILNNVWNYDYFGEMCIRDSRSILR